jgi:cell division transport system ATP-binding protein
MAVVFVQKTDIYHQKDLILKDVNFRMQAGEVVYLVGKTGTGKSSLLNILNGDIPLQKGKITVAGFDLNGMTEKERCNYRRNIGVITADNQAVSNDTLNEILLLLLRATGWHTRRLMQLKADDVLDKVGLRSKGNRKATEISVGERQLFKIAIALLNTPKVLFIDGFGSQFDPETADEMGQLLFQLAANYRTAILMATHNYVFINRFPSRLLSIKQGVLYDNAQDYEYDMGNQKEVKDISYVFEE